MSNRRVISFSCDVGGPDVGSVGDLDGFSVVGFDGLGGDGRSGEERLLFGTDARCWVCLVGRRRRVCGGERRRDWFDLQADDQIWEMLMLRDMARRWGSSWSKGFANVGMMK